MKPGAGSREPGAKSRESGAGSREPGAKSREPGVGSGEPGAKSRESGAGSREPGAKSREPGAGSREPGAQTRAPAAKRNIRALAGVFFGRLFENDMFSSSAAASASVMWLLALVATPGVMASGSQIFYWAHIRATAIRLGDPLILDRALLQSQAFHIDFAMAVAGVVTMMVWGSLTPDRRDALVLGPLPITAREQALGRLLALLKFFAMFIGAVAVPTAVAYNFVSVGAGNITEFPARVLGHLVAAVLAGGSVFFLLLNTQLVLAAAFGPRAIRFVTLPLQIAALLGFIAALASSEGFANAMLADGRGGVMWNPAAWFVGVYRWIAGEEREIFAMLAVRGALSGIGIIVVALVIYPLAYERCLKNVIASEGRTTGALQRGWATLAAKLLRPLLRSPLQRGLAAFMLATLGRSHPHRFLIGIYAGIAFLIALPIAGRLFLEPVTEWRRYAWFAVPLGFVFWLVCGVRVAMMMPVDTIANWVFRLTEPVDKRRVLSTVVTVMAFVTCIPIATIAAGALLLLGEQTLAATVFVIVTLAGLCLIEMLTITMKTVPFTCTYLPGQLRLRLFWPLYFFLWLNFCFRLTDWSLWALGNRTRTIQLAAFLIAIWAALRVWHMLRVKRITAFTYDEQEPPLVTTMNVQGLQRL